MTIRGYKRISVFLEESQSLDQQEHLIGRWAEYEHPGVELAWYEDPGVSGGRPLAKRRDGQKLLADLKRGDVLAVIKIDRLARSVLDLLNVLEYCDKVGATFVATEQKIDTGGPYGRFMLTLLGALAELERGIVSERVLAARAHFLRDQRYGIGPLPYGFHGVPRDGRPGLVVRPIWDEGPCVRCRDETDLPVEHRAEGRWLREAVLNIMAGATQASQAEALSMPQPTLSHLLRSKRLYGQTPGGHRDPEAGVLSVHEWRQLQGMLGDPQVRSRTLGYGATLRCCGCRGRLYLDRARDRYRCQNKHEGRMTISRRPTDEYVERFFVEHFGDAPVVTVEPASDAERLERLAVVELAIEETTAALAAADEDKEADLMADLRRLKAERKQVEAEPQGETAVRIDSSKTYLDLWNLATPEERAESAAQHMEVTVYPAGHPGGRLQGRERVPSVV